MAEPGGHTSCWLCVCLSPSGAYLTHGYSCIGWRGPWALEAPKYKAKFWVEIDTEMKAYVITKLTAELKSDSSLYSTEMK